MRGLRRLSIKYITHCLILLFLIGLFCTAWPKFSIAGEGHEECSICHGVHTAKEFRLFPMGLNTKIINPNTKKKLGELDALCMRCHATKPEGEGIRVLDLAKKHYFGGKATIVKLPLASRQFLKGQEDLLTCLGCHDPHPANTNYCYLRTEKGINIFDKKDIKKFCQWCHPKLEILLEDTK